MPGRGNKVKFADGEKVLCYEPDPLMAKVLYESKILECIQSKDDRGKKTVEYRIHFNGWNRSWDRCVPEESILPITEENRQLQKQLFEEATMKLKKSREKKAVRKRKNDDMDIDSIDDSSDKVKSQDDSSSSSSSSEEDVSSEEENEKVVVTIELTPSLKEVLNYDCHQIKSESKVMELTCQPNVVTILEAFVKNFGVDVLCTGDKPKLNPPIPEDADSQINLCKEVVDGLRIYFDVMLPKILLYNEEMAQYKAVINAYKDQLKQLKAAPCDKKVEPKQPKEEPKKQSDTEEGKNKDSCDENPIRNQMKSGRGRGRRTSDSVTSRKQRNYPLRHSHSASEARKRGERKTADVVIMKGASDATVGTRLRSSSTSSPPRAPPVSKRGKKHKTAPRKGTPTEIKLEDQKIEEEDKPDEIVKMETEAVATATPCESVVNQKQDKVGSVLSWKLVPDDVCKMEPVMPSYIYGATHLLRMFVRIPDLLSRSDIKEQKMDVILHFVSQFLLYMNERKDELFSKDNYIDKPAEYTQFKFNFLSS